MKKLREEGFRNYLRGSEKKCVRLFRDDLEALLDIVRSSDSECKIQSDGYEFDDVQEFLAYDKPSVLDLRLSVVPKKGGALRSLHEYVTLRICPADCFRLISDKNNARLLGIATQFDELVERRIRNKGKTVILHRSYSYSPRKVEPIRAQESKASHAETPPTGEFPPQAQRPLLWKVLIPILVGLAVLVVGGLILAWLTNWFGLRG